MSARSIRTALWAVALGAALIAAPRPAAHGAEVIGVSGTPITLDGNKGELVRLSRPAATVFVADPDIADVQVKSPRLIYVFGKKAGETTLYAVDAHEQVLLSRTVNVTPNLGRLRDALKRMLPNETINVHSVDGAIVLSGSVSSARDAEEARKLTRQLVKDDGSLVNHLNVTAPNQVQLRVRVAEVRRDILKTLGINWDAIVSAGKFAFGLATGNPVLAGGAVLGAMGGRTFNTRNIVGTQNTGSIFGGFRSGSADINALVDALDNEGLITVLAEPNLTAVSGEQATFLAGGEFPILVPDDNNRVTVEFKQFGVSLAFKPVLIGQNRINLKVSPEVSQLSNTGAVTINNFQIPALTTRRAQTTVELGSGQSFVIAGLLQNNLTHSLNKLPGLGDLPVLGPLFRSDQFQRNESELVIIVTPYIVRPVSTKIAAPTDGLIPPSDVDRILFGRMQHPTTGKGHGRVVGKEGQGLVGPVGYVLD